MQKEVRDILFNFRRFAPTFLKIKDEFGNIVPLRFNTAQLKVLDIIEDLERQGKPVKLIVLKARQQGISTLIQAKMFHMGLVNTYQRALTMGHELDASNNLYTMYQLYYDKLPSFLQPKLKRNNEKKIEYLKTGSANKIATAGDATGGAGKGRAFYSNAKEVMLGLKQGSKYAKMFVMESTANGIGGIFYDTWQEPSGYTRVFLSWLEFPDYLENAIKSGNLIDFKEGELERFKKDIGNSKYNAYPNEEKELLEDYGATYLQLKWRRYAIDDLCNHDVEQFHQEYPRDPEEAFISTGRPVFNVQICRENFEATKKLKPLRQGELVIRYDNCEAYRNLDRPSFKETIPFIEDIEFIDDSRGAIKIWTDLNLINGEKYRFAAGCDVAEGDEICLTWHGHIDPDMLAEEQYKIWWFLNRDIHFATEKNNHGLTTITKAYELGLPQYYRQDFSKGYEERTLDLGFNTNVKTKKQLVDTLNEYIRDQIFKDYDNEFWKQALTFVRNPKGQAQAEGKDRDPSVKNYDDMVIAEGLSIICSLWLPSFMGKNEEDILARPFAKQPLSKKGIVRY